MSFTTLWSGNFHQLRSSFGYNCIYKLLRFQSGLPPGKAVDARLCSSRILTIKAGGRKQNSQSSKPYNISLNLNAGSVKSSSNTSINKVQLPDYKAVECYSLQQIPERKVFDWPAVIIAFDIETTGLRRENERIIEIAIRDLAGGKNSTFETLVNPGKFVQNSFIHKIRSDKVNRPDVPRFEELVPFLLQFVKSRQLDGKPIVWVAHNGRGFDVPFLIKEFERCSLEIPEDWLFLDTLPLARQLVNPDGTKLKSHRLEALQDFFKIPSEGPTHRAAVDAKIVAYVLRGITFHLKLTVPDLIEKTFRASDVKKSTPSKGAKR